MDEQEQVEEQVQVQTEIPEETPRKEVEVSPELQKYQNEISGLNRRNTELEKLIKEKDSVLEEQKKASMEESERREYELQQRENALAAKEQEITRLTNRDKASKFMVENNLDISLLDTISLDNWEVAEGKLLIMKSVVDSVKQKTIDEFKTSNGHTPAPGGGTVPQMITREQLATMTPEEISKAVDEGRVRGIGSTR